MTRHDSPSTPSESDARSPAPRAPLRLRGGSFGALLPFLVFLAGVATLGLAGAPDEKGFWPILLAALGVGLLLARDKGQYADVVFEGMSQKVGMIMVMAWLLAGVFAALLRAGGLVDGLVWLATGVGLSGPTFVLAAFLAACVLSTATGTSLGTLILGVPLLYPAGVALGASPPVLMGALLGGATFGDNLSPVSDTTIASAATQDADLGGVVRSRLRYALPAAALAAIGYLVSARTAEAVSPPAASAGPEGLLLLAGPLLVVVALLRGRHLLEGLFLGIAATALLALSTGLLEGGQLLYIDVEHYGARGLFVEGMERSTGLVIFTLLLLGLVRVVEATGIVEAGLARAERRIRSRRGAEASIVLTLAAAVLLTTHSVVAILAVGPFARRWGEDYDIGPYRRANLLDVTSCTFPFLVPYCIPTVLAAALTRGLGDAPALSATTIGWHNLHSWALLAIVFLAVATGYGGEKEAPAHSPGR